MEIRIKRGFSRSYEHWLLLKECSVSDTGAESFSLLSRRCRTRQFQTELALMAAQFPNELIMKRKAPTRTKEIRPSVCSISGNGKGSIIDLLDEEKLTSTLQKGLQCWVLHVKSRTMSHFAKYIDFQTKFEVIYIKFIIVFGTQRIEISCIFHYLSCEW